MCQQVKAEHQKLAGLLQPLEVAKWKWEHVTMDFVTHLPQTQQKHDAVWVIMDRLTKLAHFLAVRMTFALERFCRLYIREIVKLLGHSVGYGPEVYDALLEEFPKVYRHTVDNEYNFPPSDKWSV